MMRRLGIQRNRIYSFISLIVALGIGLTIYYKITNTFCLIRGTIGIPCPACGLTRAYQYLLKGYVEGAFHYHRLFWMIPLIGLYVLYVKYYHKKMNSYLIGLIFALFLGVYLWRMITWFPNIDPMVINHKSFLFRILHFLKLI